MRIKRTYSITAGLVLCLAVCLAFIGTSSADSSGRGKKEAAKDVTFSKDVAPIFYKNCVECHRAGEGAPFSALAYKDVRPWAKSIREKVSNRQMPPWHADPHFGEFSNNRKLTQAEIDTIVSWVDQGAKEGEPKDMPKAPVFETEWNIGKPDVILEMGEAYTYKPGSDEYQYIDIPTNFKEDKYVALAEARPGNRKIVHHIIAFIVPPGSPNMSKMTAEERQKSMEMMLKNSPFYRDGFLMRLKADQPVVDDACAANDGRSGGNDSLLTGYAPGRNPDYFPAGVARKVPAGSTIRFQMHYSNQILGGNTVETDKSMVGLIFAKEPPQKLMTTNSIGNLFFKIPAGADNHRVTACRTLKRDTTVYGLMPHMHLRGKSMEYKVFYPDGKSEILLSVPNYDFAWQTNYQLKEPKRLPKGSKLMVTAYFDNSTKNKFNPDPSRDVRYGEPTYDEMMLGFMDFVTEMPAVARVETRTLDTYTGRYEVMPGVFATVTRNGNGLAIQIPMQGRIEFLPQSETKFFQKDGDLEINFVKSESGEVSEAQIDMMGRTIKAKKAREVAANGSGQ